MNSPLAGIERTLKIQVQNSKFVSGTGHKVQGEGGRQNLLNGDGFLLTLP